MKVINRSYKFRLYPNKEQEMKLAQCFGSSRFVYNYFLSKRISQYKEDGNSDNYYIQAKQLTELKKQEEYKWLNDVSSQMLQGSLRNLENAYTSFFKKKTGFPNFKKKKGKNTFSVPQGVNVENCKLFIPKFKEGIKVIIHREIKGKMLHCSISKTPTNKYFVSIATEEEYEPMVKTSKKVGIDLGIKDLVITSDGQKFANNKYLKKYEKKLASAQKHLSHKIKGSKGFERQKLKVALIHEKIANCRQDNIHKITYSLVKNYDEIYMENLQVANMMKNHKLAKSIADGSFFEITRQLNYKSNWNDRLFHQVDRFFPSSQICSVCGYRNSKTKDLSIRKWTCPNCNTEHDRDINASKNILAEGIRELKNISAGTGDYTNGDFVRPNTRKSKGQKSMKLEAHDFNRG